VVLDSSWLRLAEWQSRMRLAIFSGSAACGLMSWTTEPLLADAGELCWWR